MNRPVSETIAHLGELLSLQPGVHVVHTRVTRAYRSIVVTVADWHSLVFLNQCAEGANLWFRSATRANAFSPEALADPVSALWHEYRSDEDDDPGAERFERLGTFLVWGSHRGGLIATETANELLTLWNGALVRPGICRDPRSE